MEHPVRSWRVVAGAALALLVVAATCNYDGGTATPTPDVQPPPPPPDDFSFEDAAAVLLSHTTLTKEAHVFGAREPIPPGTGMVMEPDVGPGVYPPNDAYSYFFFIDDAPGAQFGHSVRYAVVERESVRISEMQWLPTLKTCVSGDCSHVVEWELAGEIMVLATPITALKAASSPPVASVFSRSRPSLAYAKQDVGGMPGEVPWPSARAASDRDAWAIVIDGGEKRRPWLDLWRKAIGAPAMQEALARTADRMQETLRQRGFSGTFRVSAQKPAGARGPGDFDATEAGLVEAIRSLTLASKPGDHIVIYFAGHGSQDGLPLCSGGRSCTIFAYERLASLLRDGLPVGLELDVILDTCYAGAAVKPFQDAFRYGHNLYAATNYLTQTYAWGPNNFTQLMLDPAGDTDGDGTVSFGEGIEHVRRVNPGSGAYKYGRSVFYMGQRQPATSETAAVGSVGMPVKAGSWEFQFLVRNSNPDIEFQDENARTMTPELAQHLDALAARVRAEWPDSKLYVSAAWDPTGAGHGTRSFHYEGRAADIEVFPVEKPKRKLGMLARFAAESGFRWVMYEDVKHVHVSVEEPRGCPQYLNNSLWSGEFTRSGEASETHLVNGKEVRTSWPYSTVVPLTMRMVCEGPYYNPLVGKGVQLRGIVQAFHPAFGPVEGLSANIVIYTPGQAIHFGLSDVEIVISGLSPTGRVGLSAEGNFASTWRTIGGDTSDGVSGWRGPEWLLGICPSGACPPNTRLRDKEVRFTLTWSGQEQGG